MLAFGDPACSDDRQLAAQLARQHLDDMRALLQHWRSRQATGFIAKRQAFDPFAAQGGIGGDHRIDARLDQGTGHQRRFFVAHVRGDLDRQGNVLAILPGQLPTALGQCVEQLLERVAKLQAAQARGVG
ncbi:hypothetical protein D3C77_618090 [compost metagenome]